jgi:sugar (pentulose or hexulose) kinase
MPRGLLGIDSGTSVVKSVVFDLDGHEVAVARRETPVVSPIPDSSELDMEQVWSLAAATIREVLAAAPDYTIEAVGLSGTACGYWGIDADGRPLRRAILWNDGRAGGVLGGWVADGFAHRVFEVSGNAMFPGYPLVALKWLALHEPETLERTRWLLFHKDWLRFRLTGIPYSDVSDVSYFPGEIHSGQYAPELLREAGLAACLDKLPPVAASAEIIGQVTPEAAQITGLPAGTPVAAGAVDVVASLVGGGAHRAGQACSVLGTSLLNTLLTDAPTFAPPDTGVQALMPERVYARSLVNTSGTLSIDWMREQLAAVEVQRAHDEGWNVFELIEAQMQVSLPGARGLIFLPYLNTTGIITPFVEPAARGMFFGLSVEHTRADLMRAVYEGVAFAMRDCFEVVNNPLDEILLVGGGARSGFWAQLFADVTGRHILVPDGTEFGARGVALLAGVGAGLYASLGEAVTRGVRIARTYTPQPDRVRVYTALYPLYRHLYENAGAAWRLRAEALRAASG